MSEKYKNKYRVKTVRLQNWDYASNAIYFVTICTKNRVCHFGEIKSGIMQLNELGKLVELEWQKSIELRPDMNLYLDEFVVMPNHFHAIIVIGENQYNTDRDATLSVSNGSENNIKAKDTMHCVSKDREKLNSFGSQSKNLASIIRGFKSSVTTYAKRNGLTEFKW
jgi:putative transposase